MPRIPVFDGPSVQTRALSAPMQSAPDVSSGLQAAGRALGQVAQVLDQRALRDAQLEVDKADAEITTGWLEWDAKNRRQYVGERAKDYEPAATKWWDETAQRYGGSLSPRAREVLGSALQRKRAAAMGAVVTRQGEEIERHSVALYDAKQNNDIELGIDTGDVAGAAARIRSSAAAFGAARGWGADQVQAEQQKRLATMHLAYITRVAQDNPEKASAYFQANKEEIPASAQVKIEEVLRAEVDNTFAKQFAAQNAPLPLAEQLAKASEISDPQRREKALQAVRLTHAAVKEAQAERERVASDEAWQFVGQGKRVPEAVLSRMDGKARVQLQDYLRERAKKAAEGTPVRTDWAAYIELREKLAAGEKVDLRPYAGTKLAGPQLEQLLDIQTRKNDPKKAPEVASAEQQLSTYVNQLGLSGKADQQKKGQLVAAAQDLFNEHLKRTGKEPTFDERRDILDKLVVETVTKPGLIWDTKAPTYTLPRDQLRARVAPPAGPTRVRTPEEARALPPGTRFIDPNGVERIR